MKYQIVKTTHTTLRNLNIIEGRYEFMTLANGEILVQVKNKKGLDDTAAINNPWAFSSCVDEPNVIVGEYEV